MSRSKKLKIIAGVVSVTALSLGVYFGIHEYMSMKIGLQKTNDTLRQTNDTLQSQIGRLDAQAFRVWEKKNPMGGRYTHANGAVTEVSTC